MLSLTEANTVNIILFEEHLHKICSWWLVAEDYHLEIVWSAPIGICTFQDLVAFAYVFL